MKRTPLKRRTSLKSRHGLKTRNALRAHKPMAKVSKKQKKELRLRAKVKAVLVKESPKDERGIPLCSDCGKPIDWDWRTQKNGDLSHTQRLSDCGKTTKENGRLLCRHCHNVNEHHLKEIL